MKNKLKDNINIRRPIKLERDLFINISNDEYNNIKCKICNFIPLLPIVIKNNNIKEDSDYIILCRDCYTKFEINSKNANINNIDKQYSSIIKSFVQNKEIKCIHKNKGCNWQGKLSNLDSHLINECLFQEVNCPNDGCNKLILKKDINLHLIQCEYMKNIIKVKCNYCNEEFNFDELFEHAKGCPELLVECDNGCGTKIKIKKMNEHKIFYCLEGLVKCSYYDKGCKKLIKRKFLEDHYILEKNNHLNLENQNINKINKLILLPNFDNEIRKNIKRIDINQILPSYQNQIKKEKNENIFFNDKNRVDNYEIIKNKEINNNSKNNNKKDNQNLIYENYFLKNNNNYNPFGGNQIQFITKEENIKNKYFEFYTDKIIFNGDSKNPWYSYEYCLAFSENTLDLNLVNEFKFKINFPINGGNEKEKKYFLIAFGLFITNKSNNFNVNNINFHNDNFYGIDLNNNSYKHGKMFRNETDKINIDRPITIKYIPDKTYFLLTNNFNFTTKFKYGFNDDLKIDENSEVRFCFIFQGREKAIIEYNI